MIFSQWKCNKGSAADAIATWTGKKRRTNVFRGTQTRNNVPRNIFKGLEVRKKDWLMFWIPKASMKGICDVFSGEKLRNEVSGVLNVKKDK